MPDFQLQTGGYVLSTGADLVDVDRIRQAHERQQERFLHRIFTEAEQEYCFRMKNPYPHLAARFAAKEAISKAFTTGIGRWLGWRSMSVVHGERMEPLVLLDEQAEALLRGIGGSSVRISLSHTTSQAFAVALLLK
jgi:holo-[acyl-carrier protein] synthase